MASIRLDFIPPADENIVALRVFEGTVALGPFLLIERTVEVGTFPDYISSLLTDNASDPNDWFCIAWEDDAGLVGEKSPPVKGGTQTLVSQVVERVMQRDRDLTKPVVIQETEAALEMYLGSDPYLAAPDLLGYRKLNGMVYLVLARSILWRMAQVSPVSDVQIGLVRMSSRGGTANKVDVQELFDLANSELGLNTSMVLELQRVRDALNRPNYGQNRSLVMVLEP